METVGILFGGSLKAQAKPWLEELGKSDGERLRKLLELSQSSKIRLSDALTSLFPGDDTQTGLANLTRLRNRLNDAGEGLGLRFEADTRKKNSPEQREVWFTGPDAAILRATQFSKEVTADVEGRTFVPSKGIATTGSAMAAGKRLVNFFVSYAHGDATLVQALTKELETQFRPSKRYELKMWTDREILVGEKWNERILTAIQECDFGLFMVSPGFLGSGYIRANEIPPFVGAGERKPVIPVGMVPVSFDRHDLKGLQEQQIHFHRQRTFDHMRSSKEKREFAHELYLAIEKRLDACFGENACTLAGDGGEETLGLQAGVPDWSTKGLAHHLVQRESLDPAKASLGDVWDALDELEAWALRADDSPFFALLGEVGIGKTTTLKQFTRLLIEKRQKEPGKKYPLPIYIDLRDYVGQTPGAVPTIEELLTSVIQRAWRVTDRTITAADLLRLVREENALIIFDGLDEKIVHLTQDRARDFIRTLWSVLPQAMLPRSGDVPSPPPSGKLLLSCRSHYFRDVWSQNAMLTGEDREGIDRSHYPAFCLLPFNEQQIKNYLISFLGDERRGSEAFDLIASIHNLRDLAERPYLLTLISGRLNELETLQMRGETVNAARLYDLVVKSWLSRDDGKHQLDPAHKRRLMEELAAALWRSGERQWDVDRLEEWFDEFLHQNPAIASAYAGKDRSLLKEDLRTATFVLRHSTADLHLRFAHTSLQEYFLAAYLVRALKDKADERWNMPMVSRETLDFVGQTLAPGTSETALLSLERILGSGACLPAACLAFRYWLNAMERGYPGPAPAHVNLDGADLDEKSIRGLSEDRMLDLRGASLRGVQLNRSRLEFVDLEGADLSGACIRQSLFLHVRASGASLDNAEVAGLRWRHGAAERLVSANVDWSQCELVKVAGSDGLRHAGIRVKPLASNCVAKVFVGHREPVKHFAWNSNGTAIATCSADHRVCVWEAQTGRQLITLTGHTDVVQACAWSPDGTRIASVSDDQTVRVWEVETGRELKTFRGHGKTVSCCAWSPDGKKLISGSWAGEVCVWDLDKNSLDLALSAHQEQVTAVDWCCDGRRFLSAGADRFAKTWDKSGGLLLSLEHATEVIAARWSDDGCQVLSGSRDGTVKMWDAKSGQLASDIDTGISQVGTCSWLNHKRLFAVSGLHGPVEIWNAESKRRVISLRIPSASSVGCLLSGGGESVLISSAQSCLDLWDVGSGKKLLHYGSMLDVQTSVGSPELDVTYALPDGQGCVISHDGRRIFRATPEAWRWLGWEERDSKGRFIQRLPAEVFGPIPGMEG